MNARKQWPERSEQYTNWGQVPVTLSQKRSHQFVAPFIGDLLYAISKSWLLHVVNVMANLVIQGLAYSVRFEQWHQQEYLRVRFEYSIHDQPDVTFTI